MTTLGSNEKHEPVSRNVNSTSRKVTFLGISEEESIKRFLKQRTKSVNRNGCEAWQESILSMLFAFVVLSLHKTQLSLTCDQAAIQQKHYVYLISPKRRTCTVVDLPADILSFLYAPTMVARL